MADDIHNTSAFENNRAQPSGAGRGRVLTGVRWWPQVLSSLFILSDALCVLASYMLAVPLFKSWVFDDIRRRGVEWDPSFFLLLGCGMGVITILAFGWLGLYSRRVSVLNVQEDVMLLQGLIFHAVVALSLSYLLHSYSLSRIALGLALLIIAPLIIIGRRLIRAVSAWFIAAGIGMQPVVVYGAGETGQLLAYRIFQNGHLGMRPTGFIDDETDPNTEVSFGPARRYTLPVIGGYDTLVDAMRDCGATTVLVAIPKLNTDRLRDIQEVCRVSGIACFYIPLYASGPLRRLSLTFIGDIPLVYERAMTQNLARRMIKRTVDVIIATSILLVASPVMLLAALLVRISSHGPVLFRQERVGLYGQLFVMYKFRTMHLHAPDSVAHASIQPDLIFFWGKILRKSSVDELPQLWNVLKGDMSLVGPRPEMPSIVVNYNAAQRERLQVTPGVTGLWQVSADRNFPIHENIDYDLYYIYNQSTLLDMVIVIRTFFCLFSGR